jgi:hypothetical protein
LFGLLRAAPPLDSHVLSPDVMALAQRAYDESDLSLLPHLADLLAQRGCNEAELLNHLRAGGVHQKGCWALDALLGKE